MKEMYATMKLESIGKPRHPYAWLDRPRTTGAGVTSLSCFRNQPSNRLVDRMPISSPRPLSLQASGPPISSHYFTHRPRTPHTFSPFSDPLSSDACTKAHSSKHSGKAHRTWTRCLSPPAASRALRVKSFAESGLVLAWACCLLERAAWSASRGFPVPRGLSTLPLESR